MAFKSAHLSSSACASVPLNSGSQKSKPAIGLGIDKNAIMKPIKEERLTKYPLKLFQALSDIIRLISIYLPA